FSWFGFGSEVFAAGLTMVSAAILALAFRQPALTGAIPGLVLSGYPLIQLAHVALAAALRWGTPTNTVATAFDWLIVAWAVALFTRAVAVALAAAGGDPWGGANARGGGAGCRRVFG